MIRAALLIAVAGLTGCAHDDAYPSLAPRPIEKLTFDEPARPHPAAAPDAALDTQIARHAADLDRIIKGFYAARLEAERAVAKPGAKTAGSDAWLDAQAALATLDDWRTQAGALAATVEALGSARAARLDPAYPALDALAARAGAESDREAQATEALQRQLPTG